MFNLFKKRQVSLVKHQYKNLLLSLPSHWAYELEGEGQEACFDPKSQSTLRLNIIKAAMPEGLDDEGNIAFLTPNQSYVTLPKGYLLTSGAFKESIDSGKDITLITWKLINNTGKENIIAVVTYTVLSAEKDSAHEEEIFALIENSLVNAELLNE